MKRTILITLAFALVLTPSFAQKRNGYGNGNGNGNGSGKGDCRGSHIEQRAELRSWFETKVLPSLKEWHKEYDASLTADDLAKLTKLRAEAKQLRSTTHASMLRLRDQNLDRDERKTQAKALREQTHAEMMKIMEEVKPIAKSSRAKLMEIFDRNEDQIEAWRDEVRAMKPDDCEHFGGNHQMAMLDGGRRSAMRFILWDGSEIPEPFMNDGTNSVNVAPNPAGSAATVRMDNLTNGPVTVEVFDMNGVRKASHPATVTGGSLDVSIPTADLTPGSYMISVQTPQGRKTTTMIVNR